MNYRLLCRFLGILALLIGSCMLLSLIWAFPELGYRTDPQIPATHFEASGFRALFFSAAVSWAFGGLLFRIGNTNDRRIYRKEAMAIVGLGWLMSTLLGALPYSFSGTSRGPAVRYVEPTGKVYVASPRWKLWTCWEEDARVTEDETKVIKALLSAGPVGISAAELNRQTGLNAPHVILTLRKKRQWQSRILLPGEGGRNTPAARAAHFRIGTHAMGIVDGIFEAQSGFSTTGATVIADLQDTVTVPHCILFWRSTTHFLGGLGIIALFVALLGQGSAGKSLMRAEMPGPTKEGSTARMQHTAWQFSMIYVALNTLIAILYMFCKMSMFDALCHAFATMATGGFSTYNGSLGHFQNIPGVHATAIEYITIVFMVIAGMNFALLFLAIIGNWRALVSDEESQTYMVLLLTVSAIIFGMGLYHQDTGFSDWEAGWRNSLFTVSSVMTTTGFCTADFDQWTDISRALLLTIMFVGGCSGSTAGGMKIVRHVLFAKILRIEIEQSFHPRVVRLLKFGGKAVEDQELKRGILLYFGLIAAIFFGTWLFVVAMEPDSTWEGTGLNNRLIDAGSAVATTLNNVGPGVGTVGATQNFSNFSPQNKLVFTWLMMLGRLELFPVLVLIMRPFWRDQ